MATEEHRVVIGVDYLGNQGVDRFLRDLQKLGPAAEREMRRLAEAFRNGQGALSLNAPQQGPLALPAGTGTPRVDGRFVSRQRATEAAQEQFLRGLRDRIAADRAVTQASLEYARSRRFEDKVGRIASERGGSLSFGAGGNPELAFTSGLSSAGTQLRELGTRLQRLNARVAAAEQHFGQASNRSLDREIKQYAEQHNREALRAMAQRVTGAQGTVGGDLQAELLGNILGAAQPSNNLGKTLLHHGEASSTLLNQLTEEQRQLLLGSAEGPKVYGATATTGPRIPGLINYPEARSALQGQKYGALYENKQAAEREYQAAMESRVLEARKILAIETAEVQEARHTQQAMSAASRASQRRADAEEKLAAAAAGTQSSRLHYMGAGGGSVPPPGGGGGNGRSGPSSSGAGGGDGPGDDDWVRRLNEEVRNMQGSGGFSALYRAQARLINAEQRLADIIDRGNKEIGSKGGFKTETDRGIAYRSAATAYDQAQQNLTRVISERAKAEESAARSAHAAAAAGGGGGPRRPGAGGFFDDFHRGFRGNEDVPVATQLGQTARFSVFYGTMYKLLFGITQTFQQSLQEGIAFQDALTNLKIATSATEEEMGKVKDLANDLAKESVRAGFAPSQGVEIGARSLGLYGATQSSDAVQRQVAEISARVVSQVAVGSKKTPVELQGDIAAISQALGMGAEGQQRIADLDAYFTKRFGVQQGSTFETVAQSASVGKAAGFSDEQLFAIAADMISRTGQTPSAVAGFMAQIFSRGGEGSLVDVAAKQGIDPNQELSKIVSQLAQIYRTADPRTQSEISAAFGRGKVQNAAVALLSDFSEVQAASQAGVTGAAGSANKQFEEHMANIGGQLRELGGELRQFAQLFGEAGLLDVIGAGLLVLKEFVGAANTLLGLWNELPRPMRDVIIALGVLALAARSTAVQNALGGLASGGFARGVGAGTGKQIGEGALMAAALGGQAGFAGSAKSAGRALLEIVGPAGLAIGGLLAIGSLVESANKVKDAQEQSLAALEAGDLNPLTSTGSDYRAQAAELQARATANREATGRFAQIVSFGTANNSSDAMAARLEAEAKRLERVASGIKEAEAPAPSTFRSLGAADIKTGLDALQTSGATAQTQLTALRDVLYGTAGAAKAAADAFDPGAFAGRAAGGLQSAALGALGNQQVGTRNISGGRAGSVSAPVFASSFKNDLSSYLSGDEIQKRLKQALGDNNVSSLGDLDQGTATDVATQVAAGLSENVFKGIDPETAKKLRSRIIKAIRDKLMADAAGIRATLGGTQALSGEDATAFAQSIVQQSDAALGGLGETDNRGRISELRQRIRDLRRLRGRTSDDNAQGGITAQIGEARKLLVESQLAELENIRKVAYQNATTKAQVNAAGQSALTSEIAAIVKNGSADQLVALIGAAGKSSIALAKQAIRDAIRIARAAMVIGAEAAQLGQVVNGQVQGMAAAFRGRGAQDANEGANREIQRLQKMLAAISGAAYGGGKSNKFSLKGIDVFNPTLNDGEADSAAAAKDKPTAGEIAAERATAYATRSEGQVAAARAAVQTARAQLDKAKKGTIEYYQALGSLFSAQNALTDAIQAAQKNRMLLSIDMTNPLKMAQVESRAAAIKLRQDIRQGKAGDVLAQDRVDLRSAQSNAEATRFSQRLQTVQTADQLGRISHTKYLNYLDNERKRLESIKHRTFQQQQQLDQIDGLLKEATKSMQGQFNFGDIKLPTPYEVRRYVEQTAGAAINRSAGPTSATGSHSTYLTLNVNGADTAKVTQIVQSVVGQSARTLTTAPRRR